MDTTQSDTSPSEELPAEDTFQSQITECQQIILQISLKIDSLKKLKSEVLEAVGSDMEQKISEDINAVVDEVHSKNTKMKSLLEQLNQNIETHNKNDQNGEDQNEEDQNEEAEIRVKKNLFGAMFKKYQNTCFDFQKIESEIKNIIQTKVVRNAEIALGHSLSDQQKEDVLNEPRLVQQMYEEQIKGNAPVKLQNAVSDLEERHKDIKNLERSIIKVHEMIIELSKLVFLQGEMIDNIAENISKAKDYVEQGEKNINKGKENMKKARKKKCCILIIVIVILLVIISPILITQLKK